MSGEASRGTDRPDPSNEHAVNSRGSNSQRWFIALNYTAKRGTLTLPRPHCRPGLHGDPRAPTTSRGDGPELTANGVTIPGETRMNGVVDAHGCGEAAYGSSSVDLLRTSRTKNRTVLLQVERRAGYVTFDVCLKAEDCGCLDLLEILAAIELLQQIEVAVKPGLEVVSEVGGAGRRRRLHGRQTESLDHGVDLSRCQRVNRSWRMRWRCWILERPLNSRIPSACGLGVRAARN